MTEHMDNQDYNEIFKEYKRLASQAEQTFGEIQKNYGTCVKCEVKCSDCCNAVFGLFPVEAAYLKQQFDSLDEENRREILERVAKAEQEFLELQKKIQECGDDRRKINETMARQRIRCPLLNDEQKCSLYSHRPVTCRVYGVPSVMNGKIHACWKAGFEKGKEYPTVDLDAMYKEMYDLSKKLLEKAGSSDPEKAALLISVPRSISASVDDLLR